MEKKQTAVQWLLEELRKPYSDKYVADISNKALQMERDQIEEAIEVCVLEDRRLLRQSSFFIAPTLPRPKDAANYYTQTFKP